ncbi:hypothetical protein NC652_001406 [Populus alba x Populus x berolinensis]|uniref:Uncharacterized protein n=2 Tax=Populus TaxID=3689 RepID=A0ACC4CXW7_POPAL|nr:hypothetical protein NC652_001406 [Populus alba x Populus x berolinensis]KAJ7010994.1 hypothetical protein NC653_001432 [Populus alba x Populus x berolinensis]
MNGAGPKKLNKGPLPGVQNVSGDHWKRNKVSLESEYGKLNLRELSTQEIRGLDFRRFSSCEGIYVYKESLVSFKDRNVRSASFNRNA